MNKTLGQKLTPAIGILLMIAGYLLGTLLFDTTAQQSQNESSAPMIIRVDKHNAVNTQQVCNTISV